MAIHVARPYLFAGAGAISPEWGSYSGIARVSKLAGHNLGP